MPFYAAPGVYVEEVPSEARSIGGVGTSTAAFLGTAPDAGARLGEAVAVNNWTEFTRIFASNENPAGTPLSRAVWGFFGNGGGRCYIVNLPEDAALEGGGQPRSGLELLTPIDEIAIVAAPGRTGVQNYEALLTHCERCEDRMCILDSAEVQDISQLTEVGTLSGSSRRSSSGGGSAAGESAEEGETTPPATRGGALARQSRYGTQYFPDIFIFDTLSREIVRTAPSGHIAGVWARVDTTRGVHKAPANVTVNGVLELGYLVTRQEQEVLNPLGVNVIRRFGPQGILVWGARTRADQTDPLRYLNVARTMLMIKESIAEGTNWVVFEPNDFTLWASIRTTIGDFLTRVWRDGALLGRTPEEAFFVKCDPETNPVEEREAGRVNTLVGVAIVKPAEFVVFKLSQWVGGVETESVGG